MFMLLYLPYYNLFYCFIYSSNSPEIGESMN